VQILESGELQYHIMLRLHH